MITILTTEIFGTCKMFTVHDLGKGIMMVDNYIGELYHDAGYEIFIHRSKDQAGKTVFHFTTNMWN